MQSQNRNAGIENEQVGTRSGERGWDELGDWDCHIYMGFYIYILCQTGAELGVCGDLGGGEGFQEGGCVCVCVCVWLMHFVML